MRSMSHGAGGMQGRRTVPRLAGFCMMGALLVGCGGSDPKGGALDGVITAEEATFGSSTETRILATAPVAVAAPRHVVPAMPFNVQHEAGTKMQDKKCLRQARISSLSGKPPIGVTTRASILSDACALDSAD